MNNPSESSRQGTACMHRVFMFRESMAPTLVVILGLACGLVSGCTSAYEEDIFATGHVRVVHSERYRKDIEQAVRPDVPHADLVFSGSYGLGFFVATRAAWEVLARQLAAELDSDISVVRPSDGPGYDGFQNAQIEIWRTQGFIPIISEEPPPQGFTLAAPPGATYSVRLENIFDCLADSRVVVAPLSAQDKARLASVDAVEFFSSSFHFPGYAKVDEYFRPTRSGTRRLSMIKYRRGEADWEAARYSALPPNSRSRSAKQYLVCLLNRGYSW